jgi:uncharacterized protein YlzI (FlbEa/FlbD family)
MPTSILVTMANFIILQSTLIEYNKNIEDEELQELSAIDLGDCKVLVNVNHIMMVVENQGTTILTLTNLDRLVSNNNIDEVIKKINTSQFMASIQ